MNRLFLFFCLINLLLGGCGESRESQLERARMLADSGETGAAKDIYLNLLASQPVDPDVIQGMVDVTRIASAWDEHVQWCRELIRYRPWDRYANVVMGKQLLEEGRPEDAVVRFFMAYQSSEFAQEKKEVLTLLERVRELEQLQSGGTTSNE